MSTEKVGRNDPCPCGSGLKYKKCCYLKQESSQAAVEAEKTAEAAEAEAGEKDEGESGKNDIPGKPKKFDRSPSFHKGGNNTRPQKLHRGSQRGK